MKKIIVVAYIWSIVIFTVFLFPFQVETGSELAFTKHKFIGSTIYRKVEEPFWLNYFVKVGVITAMFGTAYLFFVPKKPKSPKKSKKEQKPEHSALFNIGSPEVMKATQERWNKERMEESIGIRKNVMVYAYDVAVAKESKYEEPGELVKCEFLITVTKDEIIINRGPSKGTYPLVKNKQIDEVKTSRKGVKYLSTILPHFNENKQECLAIIDYHKFEDFTYVTIYSPDSSVMHVGKCRNYGNQCNHLANYL